MFVVIVCMIYLFYSNELCFMVNYSANGIREKEEDFSSFLLHAQSARFGQTSDFKLVICDY